MGLRAEGRNIFSARRIVAISTKPGGSSLAWTASTLLAKVTGRMMQIAKPAAGESRLKTVGLRIQFEVSRPEFDGRKP